MTPSERELLQEMANGAVLHARVLNGVGTFRVGTEDGEPVNWATVIAVWNKRLDLPDEDQGGPEDGAHRPLRHHEHGASRAQDSGGGMSTFAVRRMAERAPCPACLRVVQRRHLGSSKARARHKCPHGNWCISGLRPHGTEGWNPGDTMHATNCEACAKERREEEREAASC